MPHVAFIPRGEIIKDKSSLNQNNKEIRKKLRRKETIIRCTIQQRHNNKIKHFLRKLVCKKRHAPRDITQTVGMAKLHDSFINFVSFNLKCLLWDLANVDI